MQATPVLKNFELLHHTTVPPPVRSRSKACENCQVVSGTLYRVIAEVSSAWKLVCPTCRASVEKQPFYRYGGTWKADKRH